LVTINTYAIYGNFGWVLEYPISYPDRYSIPELLFGTSLIHEPSWLDTHLPIMLGCISWKPAVMASIQWYDGLFCWPVYLKLSRSGWLKTALQVQKMSDYSTFVLLLIESWHHRVRYERSSHRLRVYRSRPLCHLHSSVVYVPLLACCTQPIHTW